MNKARKQCEELICKVMDKLDPTEQNSEFWKKKFARMNDKQFHDFFKQDFPLKFQMKIFEIEPKMEQIVAALKIINVPLMENISLGFLYKNEKGEPVETINEALVVYSNMKKVKQFIAKKNSMSTNISKRDMKSGFLLDVDKNGNTSSREMECLAVMGCDETIRELSTYRADAMDAKSRFYNQINTTGMVSQKDVEVTKDDSLARNLLNSYLLGAHINSNLVNEEDYLPITLSQRSRKTQRAQG